MSENGRVAGQSVHAGISRRSLLAMLAAVGCGGSGRADAATAPGGRWSAERAQTWYAALPWLVGCNYVPASAVNQIEMWQAATFDLAGIDRELGWARKLGMNTARVFLHDLVWQEDPDGLRQRIDKFLTVAASHQIRSTLVLFDSAWDPNPKAGPQPAPKPGVHNSQWVQGPGPKAVADAGQRPRLRAYVEGMLEAFGRDARVLVWDIWNEPQENPGATQTPGPVHAMLQEVAGWARAKSPEQPFTSGLFSGSWANMSSLTPVQQAQLDLSDIVSFHDYGPKEDFEKRVGWLAALGRPLLCTEYLYRQGGNTFQTILPIAKRRHVAAYNWGLVEGRTQTCFAWSTRHRPGPSGCPAVWQHDILQADGSPHDPAETAFLRQITARGP